MAIASVTQMYTQKYNEIFGVKFINFFVLCTFIWWKSSMLLLKPQKTRFKNFMLVQMF